MLGKMGTPNYPMGWQGYRAPLCPQYSTWLILFVPDVNTKYLGLELYFKHLINWSVPTHHVKRLSYFEISGIWLLSSLLSQFEYNVHWMLYVILKVIQLPTQCCSKCPFLMNIHPIRVKQSQWQTIKASILIKIINDINRTYSDYLYIIVSVV